MEYLIYKFTSIPIYFLCVCACSQITTRITPYRCFEDVQIIMCMCA